MLLFDLHVPNDVPCEKPDFLTLTSFLLPQISGFL